MVFWSSFSKKIKQAVSQISFDALKRRVETIESDYATKTYADQQNTAQNTKIATNTSNIANNTNNITNNTNNINTLDTKVDGVISGLQNGNIVNYAGEYNSSTNYKLAQAVTYGGDWFVSTQNNNQGHTPTKTNNAYWVYISAPTVDLTPYLTKTSADSTYTKISTTNGIDTRLRTAEQTLNTNSSNIVNLNQTKADLSYVNSNFYNKTKQNSFNLKTYSCRLTNINIGPQSLNSGAYALTKFAFKTDLHFQERDWPNLSVIDFRFVNATRQWIYTKPIFAYLDGGYICIEYITPDTNQYQATVGAQVEVRIIKNESFIG